MRILSDEEAKDLIPIKNGRTTKVYAMVASLPAGKVLEITRHDWTGKRTPYEVVKRVAKKTNRKFEWGRMPGGKAWFVKRLE